MNAKDVQEVDGDVKVKLIVEHRVRGPLWGTEPVYSWRSVRSDGDSLHGDDESDCEA